MTKNSKTALSPAPESSLSIPSAVLKSLIQSDIYLLHMKNVQRFAQAPRGLYRSQDFFGNLEMRAVYNRPLF